MTTFKGERMSLIEKGNMAFKNKDFDIAIDLYRRAIDKNPYYEKIVGFNINYALSKKGISKDNNSVTSELKPSEKKRAIFEYFDDEYYLSVYNDIQEAGVNPVEHYLKTGWKEGRNPSRIFNTEFYLKKYPDIKKAKVNPFEHYIEKGLKEGRVGCPTFDPEYYLERYPDLKKASVNPFLHYQNNGFLEGRAPHPYFHVCDNKNLNYHHDYYNCFTELSIELFPQKPLSPLEASKLQQTTSSNIFKNKDVISYKRKKSKNRIAMYSANIGSRDIPASWNYLEGVDFYCFSDVSTGGDGLVTYLELDYKEIDNKRTALYYKTHPLKYFRDYDTIIWCDQNINIKDNSSILSKLDRFDISSFRHWGRDCLYDEAQAIISSKREDENIVKKQMEFYKEDGFPSNYGLFETNILVFKTTEKISALFECWWQEITKHARRDQLSFTYSLWKCGFTCGDIEPYPLNSRNVNRYEYKLHD